MRSSANPGRVRGHGRPGCVVAAGSAQAPVTFRAGPGGQISFSLPSQNIGCTYTPAGGTPTYRPSDGGPELSCDRVAPTDVRMVLTPSSLRRFDDVDDQGCCSADNVLPCGAGWTAGPFSCLSSETDLSRRGGRPVVSLSRARVEMR